MGETRLVRREGADVEVHLDGPANGPAMVLLPSLGRGAEDYNGIVPLLAAAGLRCIRPEPRGIGQSRGEMTGLTLHDLAADVAAVIEAERAGRVLLVGHAFGNWVARVLLNDRPEQVRAIAILAAAITTEIDPGIRASINGSFDMSLSEEERLAHLRRGYFAPGNDARVWLPGWHPPVARMQREATNATTERSWLRAAERTRLLYVAAAEDTISPPPTLEALQAAMGPRAELIVVPRAGHALLPEQPEATARALISFAGQS